MTAHAAILPRRRGACPGLLQPMPTGDGLLVRMRPIGTVPLAAFSGLCAAAHKHGNGVIEITSRGSIQIRGLSSASAPKLAADIGALEIAAQDGVTVCCNPLAGLDAELFDSAALAGELRRALACTSLAAQLGAKMSIAIDGGGTLSLKDMTADIRLCAVTSESGVLLHVAVGGDDHTASSLGFVAPEAAAEAVLRLLGIVAQHGRDARAHTIIASEGTIAFRSAITDLLGGEAPRTVSQSAEAIGLHRLRDGSMAEGISLAFGHADADTLRQLSDAARAAEASGFRTAPGRIALAIGLTPSTAPAFAAAAQRLGFITRADDPRRHVVACAGAPVCASADIAARAMAPVVAEVAASHLAGTPVIHISGCAKGCAHAASAALTIVGGPDGCALVADGSARDVPFAVVAANQLPAAIAQFMRARQHDPGRENRHG